MTFIKRYPLKGRTANPLIQRRRTHGSMQKPIDFQMPLQWIFGDAL
jgi:hypothetical protein